MKYRLLENGTIRAENMNIETAYALALAISGNVAWAPDEVFPDDGERYIISAENIVVQAMPPCPQGQDHGGDHEV